MGACEFSTTGVGETAAEAFKSAVHQAQYDYGHAGYTGTIAEKNGFVMIQDRALPPELAEALAEKLLRDDDPRISDKWGDAGCIPVDDGSFIFFGWASS